MQMVLVGDGADLSWEAFESRIVGDRGEATSPVGWALTPTRAAWICLAGERLVDVAGEGAWLQQAFEVVVFDGTTEWRWLDDHGRCRAVRLYEGPADPERSMEEWSERCTRKVLQVDDESLLLWGAPLVTAAGVPGWTRLGSARTGPYDLPVDLGASTGGALVRRRYLGLSSSGQGNVELLGTRWLRIQAATSSQGPAATEEAA